MGPGWRADRPRERPEPPGAPTGSAGAAGGAAGRADGVDDRPGPGLDTRRPAFEGHLQRLPGEGLGLPDLTPRRPQAGPVDTGLRHQQPGTGLLVAGDGLVEPPVGLLVVAGGGGRQGQDVGGHRARHEHIGEPVGPRPQPFGQHGGGLDLVEAGGHEGQVDQCRRQPGLAPVSGKPLAAIWVKRGANTSPWPASTMARAPRNVSCCSDERATSTPASASSVRPCRRRTPATNNRRPASASVQLGVAPGEQGVVGQALGQLELAGQQGGRGGGPR